MLDDEELPVETGTVGVGVVVVVVVVDVDGVVVGDGVVVVVGVAKAATEVRTPKTAAPLLRVLSVVVTKSCVFPFVNG